MILVTGATGTVGRHLVAELLAAGERVRILGEVLGRRLRLEELPPDAVRAQVRGVPPAVVEALLAVMAGQVGATAAVTQDVERVLRRPATPYRRWVARHAVDFGGVGMACG